MTERLVDTEIIDNQVRRDMFADEDGNIVERTTFDVQPAIDDAKFFRDEGFNRKAPGRLVALLPIELIEKWRVEKGINWFTASQAEKAALLNDPDNAVFRTTGGRV